VVGIIAFAAAALFGSSPGVQEMLVFLALLIVPILALRVGGVNRRVPPARAAVYAYGIAAVPALVFNVSYHALDAGTTPIGSSWIHDSRVEFWAYGSWTVWLLVAATHLTIASLHRPIRLVRAAG